MIMCNRSACLLTSLFVASLAAVVGCKGEETGSAQDRLAERQAELAAEALEEKQAEAERRKKAEEEAQKAREEAEKAALRARSAEERRKLCCETIARRGFEQRSEEDMAAKKICLQGVEQGTSLAGLEQELRKALGERELPEVCRP